MLWAAFFNFVAAFVLGTHVAKTIGSGMIDLSIVSREVVLAGLLGAIVWNLITWYYGIPVSSSHALIGGYAGAAVAKAGFAAILPAGWIKTLEFIVLAPFIGAALGFLLMVTVTWISRRSHSLPRGPGVPPPAARLGRPLQPGPRRQRRAEDDGHHHRPAHRHAPSAPGGGDPASG